MASPFLSFSFSALSSPIHDSFAGDQTRAPSPFTGSTSPDGRLKFQQNYQSYAITDLQTGVEKLSFNTWSYFSADNIWSPDSKYLYVIETLERVSDSYYGVSRVDIESAKVESIYEFEYGLSLSVAGDGKSFLVKSEGADTVAVLTESGRVVTLNATQAGIEGNGNLSEARLLDDGQFAVFVSTSSDLVPNDTNGAADVFLKNLVTGEVTLLSKAANGVQGNGASGGLEVSKDGTKILFQSSATNLVEGDTNGFQDVFVKDLVTGQVTLVSKSSSGEPGNGISRNGAFSPDGNKVVFQSTAADFVANDVNGREDVFMKDLVTGAVTPLSFFTDGKSFSSVPVTGEPAFSKDGRTVAFGKDSYELEADHLLNLNLMRQVDGSKLSAVFVSKGDGSAVQQFGFKNYLGRDTTSVGLIYEEDGDYQISIVGRYSGPSPVFDQTVSVKIRSHTGSQNFVGDASDEVVLLTSSADVAVGGAGNDQLFGGAGKDTLRGGVGDDVLDGGRGVDTLEGGAGNDRYVVNGTDDIVIEATGGGTDTVVSNVSIALVANVEALELSGNAAISGTGNKLSNAITGNGADNTLYGLGGNDVLDGRGGNDRMVGGSGNDTYYIDSLRDTVVEEKNDGIDTVYTIFNTELAANIENLVLSSPGPNLSYQTKGHGNSLNNSIIGNNVSNTLSGFDGNDRLVGNGGNDILDGGKGNDILEGGAGDDTLKGGEGVNVMIGGEGRDFYYLSSAADQVVEKVGEGNDVVFVTFDYTLASGVEIETIQVVGSAAALKGLRLTGNERNSGIAGGSGNDIIDGGAGADQLAGARGADTYIVDNAGDTITELGNDVDTLITSVGYALTAGAQVEILRFADGRSATRLDLTGNEFGQSLYGNGAASRLFGRAGDDTYFVDDSTDQVFEAGSEGNDTVVTTGSYVLGVGQEIETLKLASPTGTLARDLKGNGFANTLIGNAGANLLDGDGGADTLYGLAGNDTYTVDNAGDQVFEKAGQGTDTVRAFISYALAAGQSIEVLKLAGTDSLNLTGNEIANTLRDNVGSNRLDGGAGDDTLVSTGGRDVLIGGAGSDSAVIDRSGAKVGLSFVMKSVNATTTLVGDGTTANSIGNVTLTGGSGNDTFTTLNGIDTLNGGAGNDVLNGGTGADRMSGGTGNDTLVVDNASDRVFEAARGGIDKVLSSVSYTLQTGQEIETLQLLSSTNKAAFNLTGNEFGQSLVGNIGANTLNGGLGNDVLIGGKGADTFLFATALGSGNLDRIADFAAEDTMRLSKSVFAALAPGQLKANEFKDLAKAKVDADDHILYDSRNGNLFYDADGSGKGGAVKFAVLDNRAKLTHDDFFVI